MKSRIISLIFPMLSVILSVILLIAFFRGFGSAAFTMALGLVLSGLIPIFMIVLLKVDTSEFFIGKIILLAVLAAGFFLSFIFGESMIIRDTGTLFLPTLIFIAEAVFAGTRKANTKTQLCLFLSSQIYVYMGMFIDICRLFEKAN